MTRTPANEKTAPVNVRIPESLLLKIDEIAHREYHDRSTEVIGACKHWVEIDGNQSADALPVQSAKEIAAKLDAMMEMIQKISYIKSEIQELSQKIDDEHNRLLTIIEEGVKRR